MFDLSRSSWLLWCIGGCYYLSCLASSVVKCWVPPLQLHFSLHRFWICCSGRRLLAANTPESYSPNIIPFSFYPLIFEFSCALFCANGMFLKWFNNVAFARTRRSTEKARGRTYVVKRHVFSRWTSTLTSVWLPLIDHSNGSNVSWVGLRVNLVGQSRKLHADEWQIDVFLAHSLLQQTSSCFAITNHIICTHAHRHI